VPLVDAAMLAHRLDVLDQERRGVVDEFAMRQGPAGAALVENDDAVEVGIEEAAMGGRRPCPRPTVQEEHRNTARIAALFPVDLVPGIDPEHAGRVRFDGRVEVGTSRGVGRHGGSIAARARRVNPHGGV
jgi:hypothetical protein